VNDTDKDEIRIIQSTVLTEEQKQALTGAPIFDPEFLDAAIIGIDTNADGEVVAVYSYDLLVDCYAAHYQAEAEAGRYHLEHEEYDGNDPFYVDAQEWVDYNTLGVVPYMGARKPKIEYSEAEDE
jgi:hypothetical protein